MFINISDIKIVLIRIPAGYFNMGTENIIFGEAPIHAVSFEYDYLLGKYPITQAQWIAVMDDNPSAFRHSVELPVENVSWDLAEEFCARLSVRSGRSIRLPSEAEWEYACRAGTDTEFFFNSTGPFLDDAEIPDATRLAAADYAWFDLNSVDCTHEVGRKLANPWGLHDMIGNVWEWCSDVWHSGYHDAPNDGSSRRDVTGAQPRRSLRGGAWDMDAFRCRSTYRSFEHRSLATNRFGLRIAVDNWLR